MVERPTSLALRGDAEAIGDRGVEEASATDAVGGASPAFDPVASVAVPPAVTSSVELHVERWIILPFMECSTRHAFL